MAQEIALPTFKPREYQLPMFDAIENKGYKRVLCVWPRRSGKDFSAFVLCARACARKTQSIFYVFPEFSEGRRILWDAIDNNGNRIIDYVPPSLIESKNDQRMFIKFINGSVFQVIGSDRYDKTIVGTNAHGMVFSEYSLQDPNAYKFARPILTATNGWALFLSTPRGKNNHLWDLYQIASNHPQEWYCSLLTVNDTQHISMTDIQREIDLGELSEDMVQQEYFCSFEVGQDGYFYAAALDKIKLKGQISSVPYEPGFPVYTAWDLGINDPTVIIWFQVIGAVVHIIDYYAASNRSIDHFAKVVLDKEYIYARHFPPHDIMMREQGTGLTRREMYKRLGINFSEPYNIDLLDGIEAVKSSIPKIWIDEDRCKDLIKSLYRYKQEWDPKRKMFREVPKHDEHSHAADALRYLCLALPKAKVGTSAEELEKRYREAYYGETNQAYMPSVFRDEVREYY